LSFRDDTMHLRDILEAVDRIDSFIGDMGFDAYCNDTKTRSAVERQLQILTEAAIRLGDNADTVCPGPDWQGYRRMGNVLRHMYHRVDDKIVWNTVKDDLPQLRAAVLRALG